MQGAIKWTDTMDATLRDLRTHGATWLEVGCMLGVGREAARERGRRIGAAGLPRRMREIRRCEPQAYDAHPRNGGGRGAGSREPWDEAMRNRPPLPAGHPLSWGLLTNGTSIEGAPYPYRVFL